MGLPIAATALVAPEGIRQLLGTAYDVATQDFWTMQGLYGFRVFSDDMHDECFIEQPCGHVAPTEHNYFNSMQEWEHHFESGFGLRVKGAYNGLSASVSLSMGDSFQSKGLSERLSFHVKTGNMQKCYELPKACMFDSDTLNPRMREIIVQLPTGVFDSDAMTLWKTEFIGLVGTHMVVGSQHGAQIQSLASIDASCHYASDCLQMSACLDLDYINMVNPSLCGNHTQCRMREGCSTLYHDSCVVTGGDPGAAASLCSNVTSLEEVQGFLASGNLSSASSAIGYTLLPISDVLAFMDMPEASKALAKAVEFNGCAAPRFSWQAGDEGTFECQCVLQCENGGLLNADDCTCQCLGDELHGWSGATCTDTYGTCQMGPGSGNPDSAVKCEFDGLCASAFESHLCGATDLCCLTNFGGTCCPFGSACSCTADHCSCMDPLDPQLQLI